MTQLPSHAFYNLKEITEVLEATMQRSTNRVAGDAITILEYVNGKIARKAQNSTGALQSACYFITLSRVVLKQEFGLTESQIANANFLLSELGYMSSVGAKQYDGEWVNTWRVGPNMHISMTQFVTAEASTNRELQVEFMRWVGTHWHLVIPEDATDPVALLNDESLNKLRKIWLDSRAEREAIIAAQMDDLMDLMS